MNKTSVDITDIKEIYIKISNDGKRVLVNGEEVDLSKIISMEIQLDGKGLHFHANCVNHSLPIKDKGDYICGKF